MARVTDFTLERYVLGELSEPATRELEAALAGDPELRERVDAIRSDDVAFLKAHPPRVFVAELEMRHRFDTRQRFMAIGGFALAAAFLGVVAVSALSVDSDLGPIDTTPDAEEIRIKGPVLKVYRQDGEGGEPLSDGSVVVPGSAVQLVVARGADFGAVFSIDGRGAVTRHFPLDGEQAVPVEPGALPHAFTLDTVPDFERFFLVTSDQPFDLAAVAESLEDLDGDAEATPILGESLEFHATLLRKVNP